MPYLIAQLSLHVIIVYNIDFLFSFDGLEYDGHSIAYVVHFFKLSHLSPCMWIELRHLLFYYAGGVPAYQPRKGGGLEWTQNCRRIF
jgi:hypothetical protein